MKKMNKKGFTLIEMLAVIAIIAVLVAIIVPAVGSSTLKAKAATDAANLRSALSTATIEYASESKVTATNINVPKAKSIENGNSIVIATSGDSLVAYYVAGQNYYTVNDFATIAENGGTAVSATGSAPAADDTLATVTCK